jgi:hypothetical protein
MKIATAAERPELLGPAWDRTQDTLPEYNNHGDILNEYWPRLTEERPDFQFHLTGDEDEILARARSIPLRWDGTVEDLPAGIDGAIARGFDEVGANVLCALVIMVPRDIQGRGISAAAVRAMGDMARRHGSRVRGGALWCTGDAGRAGQRQDRLHGQPPDGAGGRWRSGLRRRPDQGRRCHGTR